MASSSTFVGLCVFALVSLHRVIAASSEVIGALPQDDECSQAACGLNALQLRSKPLPPNETVETVGVNSTAAAVNGTKKKSGCYQFGIDPTCCQDFSVSSWSRSTADRKYRECRNARLGCSRTRVAAYWDSNQRAYYYTFQCSGGCSNDCDEDTGGLHNPLPGGHRRREGGRRRGTIPGAIGDIGGGIGDILR